MADVKTVDEGSQFPEKRKLDLPNPVNNAVEEEKIDADSNKRQKIEIPSGNAVESEELLNNSAAAEEEDGEEDEDEDEEDYNAEQDEDGDEETENVDRKGKGIMTDHKGKGKMVVESDDDDSDGNDDDDDDDSSDDSDSDLSDGLDESDMEEDPLAEVDLGNILPSRTRQKGVQPGVRIISDPEKELLDELHREVIRGMRRGVGGERDDRHGGSIFPL